MKQRPVFVGAERHDHRFAYPMDGTAVVNYNLWVKSYAILPQAAIFLQ